MYVCMYICMSNSHGRAGRGWLGRVSVPSLVCSRCSGRPALIGPSRHCRRERADAAPVVGQVPGGAAEPHIPHVAPPLILVQYWFSSMLSRRKKSLFMSSMSRLVSKCTSSVEFLKTH